MNHWIEEPVLQIASDTDSLLVVADWEYEMGRIHKSLELRMVAETLKTIHFFGFTLMPTGSRYIGGCNSGSDYDFAAFMDRGDFNPLELSNWKMNRMRGLTSMKMNMVNLLIIHKSEMFDDFMGATEYCRRVHKGMASRGDYLTKPGRLAFFDNHMAKHIDQGEWLPPRDERNSGDQGHFFDEQESS